MFFDFDCFGRVMSLAHCVRCPFIFLFWCSLDGVRVSGMELDSEVLF